MYPHIVFRSCLLLRSRSWTGDSGAAVGSDGQAMASIRWKSTVLVSRGRAWPLVRAKRVEMTRSEVEAGSWLKSAATDICAIR